MPSADLAKAAKVATTSRCQNNGQSCIAAKRFIVHADVYDEFVDMFIEGCPRCVVGDPMDDGTDVGPLRRARAARTSRSRCRRGGEGRHGALGGERPDGPGWWYPPTVVDDLTAEMEMLLEEVFGPVGQALQGRRHREAVALANATRFGLGANAWTTDPDEQERFIRDLEAGQVFINGMVTSFPALPFGGMKVSGHGRELAAHGSASSPTSRPSGWPDPGLGSADEAAAHGFQPGRRPVRDEPEHRVHVEVLLDGVRQQSRGAPPGPRGTTPRRP